MQFGGFKPEAMQRIANSLGYQGTDMLGFDQYLMQNPDKKQMMDMYQNKAMQMAKGGAVKLAPGGMPDILKNQNQGELGPYQFRDPANGMIVEGGPAIFPGLGNMPQAEPQANPRALMQQTIPQQNIDSSGNLQQAMVQQATSPGLPVGSAVVPVGTTIQQGQLVSPISGQVTGQSAVPTALAGIQQADQVQPTQTAQMQPVQVADQVADAQAQTAQVGEQAQVQAAQQDVSSVSDLTAAQGTASIMQNPVQREIQQGELITGAADAEKAAKFTEQIQAAEATPSKQATVQGQLEGLMQQFEGGQTPPWAAGAMRSVTQSMISRGIGASSIAGQAMVQAAMESALPIAQADASTIAQFEAQNLSNRQQRAVLAAQQRAQFIGQEFDQAFQSRVSNSARIGDIANMNFTAEQQIALENSRATNTMNLNNLSNKQAMVMAEAAALANLDTSNLNNRQQAAVQNAATFLQTDMANLSNQQQSEIFNAQQRAQALFTDQAAANAAQQFNATSQNQTDQFFASLSNNTSQFNAAQSNAQAQFNAGQVNVLERFNAEINNQRDQFNAQNRLIIDQANAQWRRQIATADTAAVNRSNEINAAALLGISQSAYNNLWQNYSDNMEWAWTSAENERSRINQLAQVQLQADMQFDAMKYKSDAEASSGFGSLIGSLFTSDLTNTIGGSILGNIF